MSTSLSLEQLVSLSKRRGFVFQSSEIYGGLSGFWDYGSYGVELVNNLKSLWWKAVVRESVNIFGIDSAIIQNPKLWEASGHISGFNDPMVECGNCKMRFRADHLAGIDSNDLKELSLKIKGKACPNCSKKELSEPRYFNMMMKTWVGPLEDDNSLAYLRPETAGPIFTNFENVRETTRSKIPFGIAQVGKAFRNEISARDFIFRVRELEQMEVQYFIHPDKEVESYNFWREFAWDFLIKRLGIDENVLKWHEHTPDERAHYAKKAHDIYFKFPHGFKELWGTHNRTDYDLKSHMQASGKDLSYFDEVSSNRYIPYVIESSVGVGRLMMAVLTSAYDEDVINNEKRVVLRLNPKIAPVGIAVLPLSKNPELSKLAKQIFTDLSEKLDSNIEYDETQSIGKRYRRQDEIGTPFCVTIDFDSLKDKAVTIRERDTTKQQRVPINKLAESINL